MLTENLKKGHCVIFLVKICPLSVIVVDIVVVVVNFSPFHLLLQNHWANFNQTWHKVFMGERDSSCSNALFQGGDNKDIAKVH